MGHPRNKFCESRRKVGRDIYREKEFFFFQGTGDFELAVVERGND